MFSAASKTDNVSSAANYIEDVFSTYLYTGTGSAQTITNGIDISGKGGLVWIKARTNPGGAIGAQHLLTDTARGASQQLFSNLTDGQTALSALNSFGSTGFTVSAYADSNYNTATFVSWTFREQPKFFDVVTYTGNGANRTIAHNLGSVPGCIIVKRTDTTGAWQVYHRSLANTEYMVLNTTAAKATGATRWNSTTPTSTEFSLGTDATVNANGGTYVAYLFAHDAGGFGTAGTDNVISCGSFNTDGSGAATLNLGYEPQWIIIKNSSSAENWITLDNMRGWTNGAGGEQVLNPNLSAAESAGNYGDLTATGATWANLSVSKTYIYIAIRRGPMKTPTSGTSVFSPNATTAAQGTQITTNFPVDSQWHTIRTGGVSTIPRVSDRLRGVYTTTATTTPTLPYLQSSSTNAETLNSDETNYWNNTGFLSPGNWGGNSMIYWNFRRAPGFFDMVCYTGNAAATNNQTHNLGVTPEMLIFKSRNNGDNWAVFLPALNIYTVLNSTSGKLNGGSLPSAVTATTFDVGNTTGYSSVAGVNISGYTYIAYLFASCPGVSKVSSYSGTGGTQTISCGFAARFVLIKRTDSSGTWWVWDTARGMVAGTDPRLPLNTASAETNANWVYTDASGFQIVTTDATVNASGGTYIYLAIA